MSYNVLVIPEDFTKDEHILKPLVEAVMREAGKPKAVVQVCRNPNFQGITECLKVERLRQEVIRRYPMVNLFLLFVDEDGVPGRGEKLRSVVSQLRTDLEGRPFLTAMALKEVEIFPLAGHDLSAGWKWEAIRSDPNVKNTYFKQLVERERTLHLPHQGRKKLMSAAMGRWSRIKSLCPEETVGLARQIGEFIED